MERKEGQGRPPGEPKKEQGRGEKERQPLPNVWDVLERKVRLNAPDVEDRPKWPSKAYMREFDEVDRLEEEIHQKASAREKLIVDLFYAITKEPGQFPNPLHFRYLSLEGFRHLRSRLEPLSDEELAQQKRKAEDEFERKRKANPLSPLPCPGSAISV